MDKTKVSKKINDVSPSFCLAKWLQVTIDLVNGTTHSCHHPKRHHIPVEGLEDNPSQLHNTHFKKQQRKLMLEGVRPPECVYCWNIEDTPGEHYSDRFIKSSDDWAWPYLDEVKKRDWQDDIKPTYVEVMFDNTCNLSCSYCLAEVSSSIYGEMEKHGPYSVRASDHRMIQGPLKRYSQEENPYIKAFWKWLPELKNDLEVLRVTGGEPLLAKETNELLEVLQKIDFKKLSLSINTNLCLPDKILDTFIEKSKNILKTKKIKSFDLFVSVDTYGKQAEYIRKGLDYDLFIKNVKRFCEELPNGRVIIMCTYNVLSIVGFKKLLEEVLELKKSYGNLVLDLSYLRDPEYLKASMSCSNLKSIAEDDLHWMKQHQTDDGDGYSSHEVNKFARIVNWMKDSSNKKEMSNIRGDFFSFINEFDKRYNSSFLETFPEMKEFYILAKKNKFLQTF